MFKSVPTFILIATVRFLQTILNGLQEEVKERNNKEEEEVLRELEENFGGVSISPTNTPPSTALPSSSTTPPHCQRPFNKACDYCAALAIGYCNSRTKNSQTPVWTYHCKTHTPYECRIRK
jgi:hypothetical protein